MGKITLHVTGEITKEFCENLGGPNHRPDPRKGCVLSFADIGKRLRKLNADLEASRKQYSLFEEEGD